MQLNFVLWIKMNFPKLLPVMATLYISLLTASIICTLASVQGFAEIGEPCTHNDNCTTNNSDCVFPDPPETEGRCTCKSGYVNYTSTEEDECAEQGGLGIVTCMPIVNVHGERCSVDVQCMSGFLLEQSQCKNGTCQCLPTATLTFTARPFCMSYATKLGDQCLGRNGGTECRNIPYSTCIGGECSCESGRVKSEKDNVTCILAASRVGDTCNLEPAIQCSRIPNTKCDGSPMKTCQCLNESLVPNEGLDRCIERVTEIGKPCNESVQCQMENSWCVYEEVNGASRKNGTCHCLNDFVVSSKTPITCLPIANKVNDTCTESIQCSTGMGSNAECVDNKWCRCKDNGVFHNQNCFTRVPFNGTCLISEQCISNSSVIADGHPLSCVLDDFNAERNESIHKCACPRETHRELNGYCHKVTGYGLECASHAQCKASSSLMVCRANNTCGCPRDYMISAGGSECILETVKFGEPCQESRQCKVDDDGYARTFCDFELGVCECRLTWPVHYGNTCSGAGQIMFSIDAFCFIFLIGIITNMF